jgi:hypothetical protein
VNEGAADRPHTLVRERGDRCLLVVDGEGNGMNALAELVEGACDRRAVVGRLYQFETPS